MAPDARNRQALERIAGELDRPGIRRLASGEDVDEFPLSVSFDADDAEIERLLDAIVAVVTEWNEPLLGPDKENA